MNDVQLRILVADDEEIVLEVYREVLSPKKYTPETYSEVGQLADKDVGEPVIYASSQSFDLTTCRQGDETVAAVKHSLEEQRPFAVVFLDVRMPPGHDGVWAAKHIRALDPYIEIVLVTAYLDIKLTDIAHRVPPAHKLLYIQKPFQPQVIHQFASALGSKWRIEHEFRELLEALERRIEKRTVELMTMNEDLIENLLEEIEERKRAGQALQKSEERYRTVLESAPDPVVVYDTEGKVTYFNPAFSRVFGWILDESIGRTIDFVPVEKAPENRVIFEQIHCGQTLSGIETSCLTEDGKKVNVSISGAGFFDSHGKLQGSVITLQDITERKQTEEEIKFLAYHDVLTGLPNRKSFYMRLEDEIERSQDRTEEKRRLGGHNWALLFLDVDRFKDINDTLGHDVGDELLKVVAVRVQTCLRETDYVYRLGGDEFTIILNDLTEGTDVVNVAQKIRAEIARPYRIKDHDLYILVSIGISIYPDDGDNVETLVKNADMAMYAAKEENEGYRFFTKEMNEKALERMILENNLRNALRHNQFIVYYQPLVNDRNRIVGMEALLRWHHPELGLISPSQFIPLAEETGAIVPIGNWVLRCACQQTRKWHEMGYTGIYVAVNLSVRHFREPDLVETVEQVIEATGLPPDCLKLEVTESGIMENPEQAITKMKILRAQGIRFSIDDFGTGYSSLSYLKRFPIDVLKIDRSFVIDATTNTSDQEIIKTIIAMARNLGMDTVAEGVEIKEQQDLLIRHGCRIMQGYYFGRPVPAERFEDMLRTRGTGYEEKNAEG